MKKLIGMIAFIVASSAFAQSDGQNRHQNQRTARQVEQGKKKHKKHHHHHRRHHHRKAKSS